MKTRNVLEQALDKVSQKDAEDEITLPYRIKMAKLFKEAEKDGVIISYSIRLK